MKAALSIFATQIMLVAVGTLCFWGFVKILDMPGNLVPIGLFGIAIFDSIVLTLLISIALTCWLSALATFKAYSRLN